MKTSGNTILITGGSSGIGREFAKQFEALGNEVIVTGRNRAKLDEIKKTVPGVETYCSDVAVPGDIRKLYADVSKAHPKLNVLINNAGIMRETTFYKPDSDLEALTEEVTINLNGPIWMSHQFIPLLQKQSEAAILNVTSILAIVPMPTCPVYSATKAGLSSFTTSLREQLKKTSIKVFELAPQAIQTELVDIFSKEEKKDLTLLSPEVLVRSAIKAMGKDNYEIRPSQTGQVHFINRIAPKLLLKMMSRSLDRKLDGASH